MPKRLLIAFLVIIGISVLLRGVVALYLGDQIEDIPGAADQISYHTLGQRVLAGEGFSFPVPWWPATRREAPTAHWSYLYTYYVTAVYGLFGEHPVVARLIQALLTGLLQPLLVYLLANRLFGAVAGLAAAALTSIYTYFIYYGGTLMTEPFYITAILLSLYLAILLVSELENQSPLHSPPSHSKDSKPIWRVYALAIALGLSLAITVLLRQVFMIFLPILFLWMWWSLNRKHALTLLLPAVIVIAAVLPFTIFNYSRFDRFVLLNTNAGFAFFWGNHPIHGTKFIPILPSDQYLSLLPGEFNHLDEAALDQALLREGLEFVLEDPLRYILLSISRIPAFFTFWPTPDSGWISNLSRITSLGLLLPFMVYGLIVSVGAVRRLSGRLITSPIILLYLFIFFYTLIHLLSWALIRYRLPVDAVLLVFAGLAVADIYRRVGERFHLVSRPSNIPQL
jgi:4-amino-4-deoxy-L-arabinose transferase-like glycosyltransferase